MMGAFYVDPLQIARDMGVEVIGLPVVHDGVNGMIEQKDGRTTIYYDETMHPNRQRFTIAHELGHFANGHLRDRPLFRDPRKNFNLDNYDIYEVEANNYAADLLMPQDKIDFLIHHEGISSIDRMAHLLRVSPAAMTYRLQNLGYIS